MPVTTGSGISNLTPVKEHAFNSEVRELRTQLNKLIQQVALGMPGVLLSDPDMRVGTTDAAEVKFSAFNYTVRGLIETSAAQEVALTATTHDVAASKEAWLTVLIASGGTITLVQGADQTIGTVLKAIGGDNLVIVGYIKIVTGTTGFNAVTDDIAVAAQIITALEFINAPFVETVNI